MISKTWTNERVEHLEKRWKDGVSASKIALELGGAAAGITRNAVISKVHRMKLPLRQVPTRTDTVRRAHKPPSYRFGASVSATAHLPQPKLDPEPYTSSFVEVDVPPDQRKQLLDLEPDDCRWPIGDPRDPSFHFCNSKRIPGKPYCLRHANASTVPIDSRRVSRRQDQPAQTLPMRETEDV